MHKTLTDERLDIFEDIVDTAHQAARSAAAEIEALLYRLEEDVSDAAYQHVASGDADYSRLLVNLQRAHKWLDDFDPTSTQR